TARETPGSGVLALVTRPVTRQRGAVCAGDEGAGDCGCCALAAAPKTAAIARASIALATSDFIFRWCPSSEASALAWSLDQKPPSGSLRPGQVPVGDRNSRACSSGGR